MPGIPEHGGFDPEAHTITVSRNLVRPGRAPVFGDPKTMAGVRTIEIDAGAVEIVRNSLLWKKEQRLKFGPAFDDAGTLLCTPHGRSLDRHHLRLYNHLPRIARLRAAGLDVPDRWIYRLRQLSISYQLADGVDLRTVADRSGHRSEWYLARRYAMPIREAQGGGRSDGPAHRERGPGRPRDGCQQSVRKNSGSA